ncbi:MAG TPA: AAC(3) family N-acetyltransferase [Candidatus Latescibacteria bacterium]|nr:AAC(3) family N-acetyltransferase [Candidatus Latescibacterota bacterium]
MTTAHGPTSERIAAQVSALGVRESGVLLVHSSLSSMGHVEGGPETVIDGLLQALGSQGTLLLPALSYATVGAEQTHFNRETTPSCVGAITEYFRTRSGTKRSGSPTHSVCATGLLADQIVADHHLDTTPVGARSPLRKLPELGGQLLFLGCGLRPNTSMHGVEELVQPPYLFGNPVIYQLELGTQKRQITCRRHGFAGWNQRYERVAELLREDGLQQGPVLAAEAHLLETRLMWERGEAALRADPFAFVSQDG